MNNNFTDMKHLFAFCPQANDVGEAHSLIPDTVLCPDFGTTVADVSHSI
jgi:hypothetical protein